MTLMQVVYTGPTDRASAHFAGLGYTAPSVTTSIADHMLDVVIKVALAVLSGGSLVTGFPTGCLLVKDYAFQHFITCTWALPPAASAPLKHPSSLAPQHPANALPALPTLHHFSTNPGTGVRCFTAGGCLPKQRGGRAGPTGHGRAAAGVSYAGD